MDRYKEIIIPPTLKLIDTMKLINQSSLQFAVVVNEDNRLIGTITDGDIRRSILRGDSLDIEIGKVMNTNPYFGYSNKSYNDYQRFMKLNKIRQLPIVNSRQQIIDIIFLDTINYTNDNLVLLMAGGLGTRLRPLTEETPKPMLKIGGKPILETIIEGFKQYGYTNFILSVNYKKEVIQNYFQDGRPFGISIKYVEESKRMGTAGSLSLLHEKPLKPIFVMNGDLLTQVNFEQLMQFHLEQDALATMCVREFEFQIPYGVIETKGTDLVSIKEKPIHKSFVNAGIYVINPDVLEYIPKDEYSDMPYLFQQLIKDKKKTAVFPIREHWLDIGRVDDFEKANRDYKEYY